MNITAEKVQAMLVMCAKSPEAVYATYGVVEHVDPASVGVAM